MKCTSCNYEIPNGVKFCPLCGAAQPIVSVPAPAPSSPQPPPPNTYSESYNDTNDSPKYVGFGEAIALYLINYVNFSSRSTRSEYWYAYLFTSLIGICCSLIDTFLPIRILSITAWLTFFLPSLSVAFRRFHDTGRTGVFPLVNSILNFLWKIAFTIILLVLAVSFLDAIFKPNSNTQLSLTFKGLIIVLLSGLIPLSLNIYEIVICCMPGQPEPNQYGREAKE